MEPVFQAHPIPQNVTNFEFHLVGDMTLKQFAYLAAGVGFAFLIFTTLSTVQPLIAWPIIIISSLLGVAFAFLPIQERPLDHWVAAFFKAIFQPTKLKFSSKIINPTDPLFNRRLSHYLKTYKYVAAKEHAVLGNPNLLPTAMSTPMPAATPQTPTAATPTTPQKKQNFIDKFKAGQTSFVPLTTSAPLPQMQSNIPLQPIPSPKPQTAAPIPTPTPPTTPNPKPVAPPPIQTSPPPLPTPMPQQTPTPLPDLEVSKPNLAHAPVAPEPPPPTDTTPKVTRPEDLKKTVELAGEAQKTQQEIIKIEEALTQIKKKAAQPGIDPQSYIEEFQELLTQLQKLNEKASHNAKEFAQVSKEPLKPVVPETTVKAKSLPTLKLTSFPNVISGIITDSKGNYIEGAIVVAHDKQGLPVRALKSNKLGQFVAATPLPNGEYSIAVEKDDLAFDKVSVELNNEILPPILVTAKKLT